MFYTSKGSRLLWAPFICWLNQSLPDIPSYLTSILPDCQNAVNWYFKALLKHIWIIFCRSYNRVKLEISSYLIVLRGCLHVHVSCRDSHVVTGSSAGICYVARHDHTTFFHFIDRSFLSGLMDSWLSLQQQCSIIKVAECFCQIIGNFLYLCIWTLRKVFCRKMNPEMLLSDLKRKHCAEICVRDLSFDFLP